MKKSIKKFTFVFTAFFLFATLANTKGNITKAAGDTTLPTPIASYSFENNLDGAIPMTRGEAYVESTIVEGGERNLWYVDGKQGKALHLNNNVGLKLDFDLDSGMYSFGYWIRSDKIRDCTPTIIVTPTTFSADTFINIALQIGEKAPCLWTHIVTPYDIRYSIGISNAITTDEWVYLTVCVNGDQQVDDEHVLGDFYINGYLVDSGPVPNNIYTDTTTTWFGINLWDRYFTGDVDEITFYDRYLSPEQVKALYLSENGDPNAKDPNENSGGGDWGGGGNWGDRDDWEDIFGGGGGGNNNNDNNSSPSIDSHGNSTILDEWLDSNSFLHFNVSYIVPEDSTATNQFANLQGNSVNMFYLLSASFIALFAIIILSVCKKMKQKF